MDVQRRLQILAGTSTVGHYHNKMQTLYQNFFTCNHRKEGHADEKKQLQVNCIKQGVLLSFSKQSQIKKAEKSQARNLGEPSTSQLHQTAVKWDESQPDLTLIIPKAPGANNTERKSKWHIWKSANSVCIEEGKTQGRDIVGIEVYGVSFVYSSIAGICDIYRAMFPDSATVKKWNVDPQSYLP